MKPLRFIFLTVQAAMRPSEGLPVEELQTFATAWSIPAQYALRERFFSEETLASLLDNPNRAQSSQSAISLWSAQQSLCQNLKTAGIDARGLPPINGRILESFCLPAGIFWTAAYIPCESLPSSQDSLSKALGTLFGLPPKKSRTLPFPWISEFARSSVWVLGANQTFSNYIQPITPTFE